MEVKVLESSKDELKVEVGSLTIAELLRVYLNKDSAVTFAAWKREHYTMNPVLLIKTSGKDSKTVLKNAFSEILKDLDKISSDFSSSLK